MEKTRRGRIRIKNIHTKLCMSFSQKTVDHKVNESEFSQNNCEQNRFVLQNSYSQIYTNVCSIH